MRVCISKQEKKINAKKLDNIDEICTFNRTGKKYSI